MAIISSEAAVTLASAASNSVASASVALASSETSNISTNEDNSSPSANAAETTTITTPQTSLAQVLSLPSISSEPTLRLSPPSTPSIKNKFSTVIAQLSGSFLEDKELSRFLGTARFSRTACQSDIRDRKRVKEELLPHIFAGNPDAVNKFFETQGSTFATLKLLITKVGFREGYQSEKFNQFICFREWRGVSPIQVAALCGDVFLLDDLKKLIIGKNVDENHHLIEESVDDNQHLIEKNKCRLETIRQGAIQQLENVRSRVSAQKIILEAAAVVVDTYSNDNSKKNVAKLRLKKIQESETFQQQMKVFRKEMEVLRNQMNNLSEASKGSAASEAPKAQQQKDAAAFAGPPAVGSVGLTSAGPSAAAGSISTKTLDSERCRTPFVKGVDTAGVGGICGDRKTSAETKASSESSQITYADDTEFLAPVMNLIKAYIDYLIQYPILSPLRSKWGELDKLWEIVGECHKRLSHYFKQEFFDNKPFSLFENSPARGPCCFFTRKLLVLDDLGFGSCCGLQKGWAGVSCLPVWGGGAGLDPGGRGLQHDLSAVTRLYELRLTGLENIIVQLRTPEIIENLDSHQSHRSPEVAAGPGS